jgi:hypothetical protein
MLFLGHEGAFFAVRDPKKPVFGVREVDSAMRMGKKPDFAQREVDFCDVDGQKA